MPQEEREFIQRLARQRARQGKRIPESAAQFDVTLDDRHTDLWEAFLDLKSSAGMGFAPEPVTPSDVLAWCELHAVPQWRRPTFWRVVHHLDGVARREMQARKEADRGDAEGSS